MVHFMQKQGLVLIPHYCNPMDLGSEQMDLTVNLISCVYGREVITVKGEEHGR